MNRIWRARFVGAALVSFAISGSAWADTVAYWQFDADGSGTYSNASVGGPAYNLVAVGGPFSQSALSAVNPIPNPDATPGFVGSPSVNSGSLFSVANQTRYMRTSGDATVELTLAGSSTWTIEGWYNLYALPGTTLDIIWTTRDSASGFAGMTLQMNTANQLEFVVQQGGGISTNLVTSSGTSTGEWHHVALTYDAGVGNGTFDLYLNGVSAGVVEIPVAMTPATVDTSDLGYLAFGGRAASSNSVAGRLDEWRISDQALTPDQFLNYVPEPSTFALILCGLAMAWRRGRRNAGRAE